MVRNPFENHIGQRPPIHVAFLNLIVSMPRNRPKHIHSLPPPDRWPLGAKKPMGRTVPTIRNQRVSRRLERLVNSSHSSTQQLPQRHDTHRPNRSTSRVLP